MEQGGTPITTEAVVFAVVVITFVGGIFWRLWNRTAAVADDLASFKLQASKEYVSLDTFRRVEERFENLSERLLGRMDKMDASLNRIEGRLEQREADAKG